MWKYQGTMKKHKNYYYGVCIDGLLLKIAEIEQARDKLIIHRLEDFKLLTPLSMGTSEVAGAAAEDSGIRDISFESSSQSDDYDPTESDLFGDSMNLDSLDDKPSSKQDLRTPEEKSKERNEFERQSDAVQKFVSKFFMDDGKISISCLDYKLDWKFIKTNKKCTTKELRKLALSSAQMKDMSCNVDFVPLTSTTYNAVIHQGDFDIMTFINNACRNLYGPKKQLFYKYIEPINISILNIFNLFYKQPADQYTTLLYLGDETKTGIIIKDKKIVKDFPIMVFDTEPERVREAVYAKLMLEKESSEYPVMDNIVLAGDFATEDDVNFFNRRTGRDHSLFTFSTDALKKYKFSLVIGKAVDIELIPSFIIPLSLALKSILVGNPDLVNINLLPKRITESRQVFALGGAGIIFLILIFLTTIIGTNQIVAHRNKLESLITQNRLAEEELRILQNFYQLIQGHQTRIDAIQAANTRSAGIAAEKNSWSYIINTLSDFTNRNPLLWVDAITTTDARFTLRGSSYHRDRITALSTLFEDGQIVRIIETHIADHITWEYEINYARPKGEDTPVEIPLNQFATYETYLKHLEDMAAQRRQEELLRQSMALMESQMPPTTPTTQSSPIDDAATLYETARDYYLNSNFPETISLLDQYIRRYPNGAEISNAYYLLGELYFVLGNYERAVPNFNNVYRLRQDKVIESLFFLAKSNEHLSNYEAAIRHYNILIREYPNSPLARAANEQVLLLREGQ